MLNKNSSLEQHTDNNIIVTNDSSDITSIIHKQLIHIQKQYLPNEFIFLLYDNPSQFFQEQTYHELLSQPTLIDITNTSIFEHFYTTKTRDKSNTIYNQNEYLFFTALKDKFELTLSLSKNSFLHFLSIYKNDIQMINKLFEYKCISEKFILIKNKKEELFYKDLITYATHNKQLQNKEQYITFFNNLMSFPNVYKQFTRDDKNNILFLIYGNDIINNKNIRKEPLLIVNTIKQFPRNIDPYFVNEFIYMKHIDLNLLDVLIENGLWNESKEVIHHLENVVTEKTNCNLWLVSHFYHFLERVDFGLNYDKINDYVNCVINGIKTISTGVSTFWNKSLYNKNVFHYLFNNKTASKSLDNLKLVYENINTLFLYESKDYQSNLLSLKQSKLCFCFIPSIYLLNTYEGEIDFHFEEFFNDISQYFLRRNICFGKYGLYMLQYFIKTNQPHKVEFIYLNMLKHENNKQLLTYLSKLKLYYSEKNIDLFKVLLSICEEIHNNEFYYTFISNNICFIKLCDGSNWINSSFIRHNNFDLFKVILQNSFFTFDDIKQLWLVIFNTLDKLSLITFVKNILTFTIQSKSNYQKIIDIIKTDYRLLQKLINKYNNDNLYNITFSDEMIDVSLIYDILYIDKGNILSLKKHFSNNSNINYIFVSFYLFIEAVSQESKDILYDLLYKSNIIKIQRDILKLILNYYKESIEIYKNKEHNYNVKQNEIEQINLNEYIEKNMCTCWHEFFKHKNIINKIKYNLVGYYLIYLENKINVSEYNQLVINILTNPDISNSTTEVVDKNIMKLKLLNFICPIRYKNSEMNLNLKRLYEIIYNKLKTREIILELKKIHSFPLIDTITIQNLLRNNIVCEHLIKVIEQKEQTSLISYLLLNESIYNEYINLYLWYLPPKVTLFLYNNQLQNIFYNNTLTINPFLFLLNKNTKSSMIHYVDLFKTIILNNPYTNKTNTKYTHEFPRYLNKYFHYELHSKVNRFFTNTQQFITSIGNETFLNFLNKHLAFKEAFCHLLNCFVFSKKKPSFLIAKNLPTIFSFPDKETYTYKTLNYLLPYIIYFNLLNVIMLTTILNSIQPINKYYDLFKRISIFVICYGTDELKNEFFNMFFTSISKIHNEHSQMKNHQIMNLILLYSIFIDDLDLFIKITNVFQVNSKEQMKHFIMSNDFPVNYKTLKNQKKTNEFIRFVLLNNKYLLHVRMVKCFSINILKYCLEYKNDNHNNNNSQSDGFVINYELPIQISFKEIEIHKKNQHDVTTGNNFILGKYIIKKNNNSILCLFFDDYYKITTIYHSLFPLSNKITYYKIPNKNNLSGPFYSYINPLICLFDNDFSKTKENFINTILNMKYTFIFQEFLSIGEDTITNFQTSKKYKTLKFAEYLHDKSLSVNTIINSLQNLLDMINTLTKEKFLELLKQNECIQISLNSILNYLLFSIQIYNKQDSQFISLLLQVVSQIYPYCILNYKCLINSTCLIYITKSISELIKLCNFNLEEVFITYITKLMNVWKHSEISNLIIKFFNAILQNSSINVIEQFISIYIKLLKQQNFSNEKDKNIGTILQLCFNSNNVIQYIFLCFSVYKNNISLFQFLISNCSIAKEDENMNKISIKRFLKNHCYWSTICEGKNDFTKMIKKKSLFSLLEFIVLNEKSKDIMNYYLGNVYSLTKENITDKTIYLILRTGNFTLYNKFKSIIFPLKEEHIEILLDYCNRKNDNNFADEVFKFLNLSSYELFNSFTKINYTNEFLLGFYNEMNIDDKKQLFKVDNENNNDTYKNRLENLFYSIVKSNNEVILLDLLRLYENKNFEILSKAFNVSMKLNDFKCLLHFMKYDLFTQITLDKLLEIFAHLPIYDFYIWIKNNESFLEDLTASLQTKCQAIIHIGNILYKFSEAFINEFFFYKLIIRVINKVLLEILVFQDRITITSLIKPFLNINNISLINSIILLMIQKLNIPIHHSDIVDIFNITPPINETYAILLLYLYEIENNINITDMKALFPIDIFIQNNIINDIYNLECFPIYINKHEINIESPEKQIEIISPIVKKIGNNIWPTLNLIFDIKQITESNDQELNDIILSEKYNITNILYKLNMKWRYLFINKPPSNKSIIKLKEETNDGTNDSYITNFLLNQTIKYEKASKSILIIQLEMLINMYNQIMFLFENNTLLKYYYFTIKEDEMELLFTFLNEELIDTIKNIINTIINSIFVPTTSSDEPTIIHFSIQDENVITNIINNFNKLLNDNLSKDTNIIDDYWKNLNYIYTTMDKIENIYGHIENPFTVYKISLKFVYEKDKEKAQENTNKSLLTLFQILTKNNFSTQLNPKITQEQISITFSFNFEEDNILTPIETSTSLHIEKFIYLLWKLVYKLNYRLRIPKKDGYQNYCEYMFLISTYSNYHLGTQINNAINEIYVPFKQRTQNIENKIIVDKKYLHKKQKEKFSHILNDVEFLEFMKYSDEQGLTSKNNHHSFIIHYIEKYCDVDYLLNRKYLYNSFEEDLLEITKKQSKPFKTFLTYESLSPKIINSYDIISHIYQNHHKDIPNLIQNFYSRLIEFNKRLQLLSKDIYNVEIHLENLKNIIDIYIENNGLTFTLSKKQDWINLYKETIFNILSKTLFGDSENNSLFNCVIQTYKEIRLKTNEFKEENYFKKTKKSLIIKVLPHTWSKKAIKLNRYNEENLNECFDFSLSDFSEDKGKVNVSLNITLRPIKLVGTVQDFIDYVRKSYN